MSEMPRRCCLLLLLLLFLSACSALPGDSASPVVIEWTTVTEVETAGFNLYRSESPQGPFTQINADMIPASGQALTGSKYRYEDRDATPGHTYYYQLEDVELGGATTRHPAAAVTAESPFALSLPEIVVIVVAAAGALAVVLLAARRRAAS